MRLTGVHLLMTYACNLQCDHCFVWGGPAQTGTMTLARIREILRQAEDLRTVDWIYFEGGEPFLYYALLLRGVEMAAESGFRVGIVSNGYWATDREDALEWLRPLRGLVQDLSISSDGYHGDELSHRQSRNACAAAAEMDIPAAVISIAQPDATDTAAATGQIPEGASAVMYRGRAAEQLAPKVAGRPWSEFNECPCEDLREPGRVHVDPFGHVHVCQGISIGNVLESTLSEICAVYDPDAHPVVGPILAGGPAELARRYGLPHAEHCADACHLCDQARHALRARYREILTPDQMYGVVTPWE